MKYSGLLRQIANRYLFSKKSHSVINIISIVSALSLSVPVAAMIILLSVHNGLSDFIIKLNSSFEPELKVVSKEGRFFELSNNDLSDLSKIEGVSAISRVIENDVLLEYKGKYSFLTARGVDSLFPKVIPIEKALIRGEWNSRGAFIGLTAVYEITQGGAIENHVTLHSPQPSGEATFIPMPLYRSSEVELSGIYSLDTDTELKYILVPLTTTEELLNKAGMATAVFIKVDSTSDLKDTHIRVDKWAEQHNTLKITTQQDENKSQYAILKQEKFAVFIILTLVILVASFTLIGAVVMLMIEKEKEARLLSILGLRKTDVRRIFILQGVILSSYGIALGTIIGVSISHLQQKFGFVKIEGASPLLESYPVIVSATDTLMTIVTVFVLSLLIVIFTVKINKFTSIKNG